MSDLPRCLAAENDFPHRVELLDAVTSASAIRKDDRSLPVSRLLSTYIIRLRLAQGRGTSAQISDLINLVEGLKNHIDHEANIWFVHAADGTRFYLFECADTGVALGCLKGNSQWPSEVQRRL